MLYAESHGGSLERRGARAGLRREFGPGVRFEDETRLATQSSGKAAASPAAPVVKAPVTAVPKAAASPPAPVVKAPVTASAQSSSQPCSTSRQSTGDGSARLWL